VTNRHNGRTVLIRVNDRVPESNQQAIIVSQRTAELLGFRQAGRAMVDIQYAGPAAPQPNGRHEQAFLEQQPWFQRDLQQHSRARRGSVGDAGVTNEQRYPPPTYPRWDGTRRE
jgi:rare lipoprotein A (peptidoglycan hydrolase)